MGNGCGGEGGIKFILLKDRLKKLKYFDSTKIDSLYFSIETRACNPHDIAFLNGGWIKEFYKANMDFIDEVVDILHWTNIVGRVFIFIILFVGLNTLGVRYFNWKLPKDSKLKPILNNVMFQYRVIKNKLIIIKNNLLKDKK